ncbi:MAG TPA: T9SS type A sorting domain-containing protein, partial [Saprospiraceae bacterium]|nr:T9SS type A sorting domain-containing protein [Saprospiraceae bacterium]
TVLHIFFDQYLNAGLPLTSQQTSDLTTIADLCRYEGGLAVVLARLALGQASVRTGDCNGSSWSQGEGGEDRLSLAVENSIGSLRVAPNPAKGQFEVLTDRPLESGTAILTDLNGRQIGTWPMSGASLSINCSGISPGIYLLEVREEKSQTVQHAKVTILR